MELKEIETRALVLVKGARNDAAPRPEVLEPEQLVSEPVSSELDRVAVFAAELRLTVVRRACTWRLRPSSVLSALALVLGKLAATAVRGDSESLALLVEELHRDMCAGAAAAIRPREVL